MFVSFHCSRRRPAGYAEVTDRDALMLRGRLSTINEISEGSRSSMIERIPLVLRHEQEVDRAAMLRIEQTVAFALAVADR